MAEEEGAGAGAGGSEVVVSAPPTTIRRVLLISAGASHSVALLCKILLLVLSFSLFFLCFINPKSNTHYRTPTFLVDLIA